MMQEHMDSIEHKLKLQSEDFNNKIQTVANEVRKFTTERQKQLDYAGQMIKQRTVESSDIVTKCAFGVLECVRQAILGDVGALFRFALSVTPAHLQPATPPTDDCSRQLQEALNFIVPLPNAQ
jgi:hypothetical protein